MTVQEKARELWAKFNDSERHGIRFGLFPNDKIVAAQKEGHDAHKLAIVLMDLADKNGGMRA